MSRELDTFRREVRGATLDRILRILFVAFKGARERAADFGQFSRAVPFIPFKINSAGPTSTSPHWRRMWAHFSLRNDDFLARYHRRSNVESAMWMIKSKFGGWVRSKLPTAQVNEVLAKVLLHNLCCIVHAITEFGLDIDLGRPSAMAA